MSSHIHPLGAADANTNSWQPGSTKKRLIPASPVSAEWLQISNEIQNGGWGRREEGRREVVEY